MVGNRLGPFEILARVNLRGFGEVYAARDHENDRGVAIHVLRSNAAQDEDVRDRFEQDVRAAAARVQPGPLTIHLIGVDPQAVYVVSEPIRPAPLTPVLTPADADVVRHDVRAPRRGWAAVALAAAAAVVVAMLTMGGDDEPGEEPAEETSAQAGAAVEAPVIPAPPPIPQLELLPPEQTEVREEVVIEPRPGVGTSAERETEPRVPVAALRTETPPTPAPTPAPAAPPRPATVTDSRDATTLITEATVHATEFNVDGALSLLDVAAGRGDAFAPMAVLYLRGLISARDAFREGGDPKALAPVQASLMALGEISKGRPGAAEIARLVLQAAAAAAQSERDEMRLYIDSAVEMESLQLAARQGGAPIVSASELAGDFWLQVSRYDEARKAYTDAAERIGFTLRILSGLARTARRLNDTPAACSAYRRLADVWGARPGLPVEIAEARAYLGGCPR